LNWSLLDDGSSDVAPEKRSYHAMTCLDDNRIYVFGGCGTTRLNDFFCFDKAKSQWTRLASDDRIEPRGGSSLCSYKEPTTGREFIYCVGGFCGHELDNCFRYSVEQNKWSPISSLPMGLSVFALSALNDASASGIFILHGGEIGPSRGGHEVAGQFSAESFLFDGQDWKNIEIDQEHEMPCARAWHASSYFNGKLYVYGGLDQNNTRLGDLYELTLKAV
jgi:N-acetylneuraminic acid mutarotase